MKKTFRIFLFAAILCILGSGISSCHRGPSCPAYSNIDPGNKNMYNPNNEAKKTGNNKKDVERKKKEELSTTYNRNKSSSLFPKYMRKQMGM